MVGGSGAHSGERASAADLLIGVIIALVITAVWVALGFTAVNTNYHLAPLVITVAPIVMVRLHREDRLDLPTTVAALTGGVFTAALGALVLLALVAFDGPTLAAGLSPEAEAIIMVAIGVLIGLLIGRGGRDPVRDDPRDA
jgi:amino acid transporter